MKYYKLLYDYEHDDNYIFCDIGNIGDIYEYSVFKGLNIDDWKTPEFEYDNSGGSIISDYVSNIYTWLVVTNRFVTVMKDIVQGQIQYLPVKITEKNTSKELKDCYVANIVNLIDALDLEYSEYDTLNSRGKDIVVLRKPALKKNIVNGNNIFRLEKDTMPVFVSDKFRKAIKANGLLGFDFQEVKLVD